MRRLRARVWLLVVAASIAPAFADDDAAALQQKIDAARARLDAAARELAELHRQETPDAVPMHAPGPPSKASLGVLLVPGNGAGAAVAGVTPGGAAAAAGIAAGDVLIAIDGTSLRDPRAPPIAKMFDAMKDVVPGDTVHVDYVRNGVTLSTDVTASDPVPPGGAFAVSTLAFDGAFDGNTDAPPQVDVAYGVAAAPPPAFVPALPVGGRVMVGGVELFDLDEQLGHYFGVSDGVLVLRSPSDQDGNGLLAGDVVKTVGGRAVATSADCLQQLTAHDTPVEVLRDGVLVTVDVKALRGPTLVTQPRAAGRLRSDGAATAAGPPDVLVAQPIAQ